MACKTLQKTLFVLMIFSIRRLQEANRTLAHYVSKMAESNIC